jgi:hypothetical protein
MVQLEGDQGGSLRVVQSRSREAGKNFEKVLDAERVLGYK